MHTYINTYREIDLQKGIIKIYLSLLKFLAKIIYFYECHLKKANYFNDETLLINFVFQFLPC